MSAEPKRAFKVVLVGNAQVGKTSVRRKYMGRQFRADYLRTIGADFASVRVHARGELTLLTIWDLAGQSAFDGMRMSFYQGSKSCLVVFDVTDPSSLDDTTTWAEEAVEYSRGLLTNVYLVGNKIDLVDDRMVTAEAAIAKAHELAEKTGLPVTLVETSALTGANIKDLFDDLVEMLIKLEDGGQPAETPEVRQLSGQGIPASELSLAERVAQLEAKLEALQNQVDELSRKTQ